MNGFSLLAILTILFLFRCHLSEEKKFPGKREREPCPDDLHLEGKCDNFCQTWGKTGHTDCVVENFDGEDPEVVASCYCSTDPDTPPPSENVIDCLIDGCSGCDCDEARIRCSNRRRRKKEIKLVAMNRTVAECSESDAEKSCVEFCLNWDKRANSFCVVESFGGDESGNIESCYCSQGSESDSIRDQVYDCLEDNCQGYLRCNGGHHGSREE